MSSSPRVPARVALFGAALVLLVVLLTVAAPLALADSPVSWAPTDSSYGPTPSPTPFSTAFPVPAGYGGASLGTLESTAVAGGYWDAVAGVYTVGFETPPFTIGVLPSIDRTDLSGTPLTAGTRLSMVFTKAAGQKIASVAMLADPNAPVALDYAPAASLTDATTFTVTASVVDPAPSASDPSGDVDAAFGLLIDCSTDPARNAYGSIFVTDMSWLDLAPPASVSSDHAGLRANGSNGHVVTFDGLLSEGLRTSWGIGLGTPVKGFVDASAISGGAATFTQCGAGTGSDWPLGYYKYRISNSAWSKHDILWGLKGGKAVPPVKATGISPKGTVGGTRPTFKWRAAGGATSYAVRVYRGTKLLLKKTGATGLAWRAPKALPKGVSLTWKVRAANTAGAGPWSASLRFKIK
jgi:hypothetical protein